MTEHSRYTRYKPLLCVTCSGQHSRYERYTPLGGVTNVTLTQMVPMPPFNSGYGTGVGTVSFSLPKNRGKDHG
jgi:hypothetical protein